MYLRSESGFPEFHHSVALPGCFLMVVQPLSVIPAACRSGCLHLVLDRPPSFRHAFRWEKGRITNGVWYGLPLKFQRKRAMEICYLVEHLANVIVDLLHVRWKSMKDLRAEVSRVLCFYQDLCRMTQVEYTRKKCQVCQNTCGQCWGVWSITISNPRWTFE